MTTQSDPIVDYYNRLAPEYDQDRFDNSYGRFIHRQEVMFLKKYLEHNPGLTLEAGCGTGRFMHFADYGIDVSEEMLKVASENHPGKHFLLSDAACTPFEAGFFNRIFSMHVIMHLSSEKTSAIFQEAYRLLKPGGRFAFDFPSVKRRKLSGYKKEGWHGANSLSLKEVEQMCGSSWKVVDSSGIMFLPVHRIPVFLRKYMVSLDRFLCRSFLKEYASYLIIVLEKK